MGSSFLSRQAPVAAWLFLVVLASSALAGVSNLDRCVVTDHWANRRFVTDYFHDDTKAVVFFFMKPACPVVRLYLPAIIEMEKGYRERGVQFVGVYPNASETLVSMAIHSHDNEIPFPVVKDTQNCLTDALGVKRTPEVVVLDADRNIRYQGAIDDQYRAGGRKANAAREYLRDAINQLLAGQEIKTPLTLATGCLVERHNPKREFNKVTYNKDVAPLIQAKCEYCHRPNEVGPFSLTDYDEVLSHGRMIGEVVLDRRMPPWHAHMDEKKFGKFKNDRRLTENEIDIIEAWVNTGMNEGDAADRPKSIDWSQQIRLENPDAVIEMPEAYEVPAFGQIPYRYITIPTEFTEHKFIKAVEVVPGDRSVVHHVNVHITSPKRNKFFGTLAGPQLYGMDGSKAKILGNYVPGATIRTFSEDYGAMIPRGYKLTFEMHYTPNGVATTDRTKVKIVFADQPPKKLIKAHGFMRRGLAIPPNDPHHRVENSISFGYPIDIISLRPHMHVRGKHWRYEVTYPDGREETLLSIPRWDYDWQSLYEFETPIRLPAGTEIRAIAHFDNSRNNPNNPDPSQEVTWGLDTYDEMMLGWIRYVRLDPELAKKD